MYKHNKVIDQTQRTKQTTDGGHRASFFKFHIEFCRMTHIYILFLIFQKSLPAAKLMKAAPRARICLSFITKPNKIANDMLASIARMDKIIIARVALIQSVAAETYDHCYMYLTEYALCLAIFHAIFRMSVLIYNLF